MASLNRQVTQNGLGVINAIARGIYNDVVEVTVVMYDEDLVAMMSGGVLDVEPSLISRNTLGNGKTVNSKSQRQMSKEGSGKVVVVAEVLGETRSKWVKVAEGYDGLYTVAELKARSLSSRNTLGDTSHNTNKIGLSWGGGSVWWARLCGSYGGG
jgi:hypothetical protein